MKRYWTAPGLLVLGLMTLEAFGHVGVFPRQAQSGAPHQFLTVRAPVEKEIPTTELRIEIPPEWKAAGGQVDRVELDPLWQVELERDEDDWIQAITWSGAEAPSYSFIGFQLIVSMPKLTGLQQIKAFQKYSDGSVVSWIEDANLGRDAEKPAARLMLTEGGESGGPGMLSLGLSGLLGGLIGAGVALVVSRNGRKSD